MAVPETLLKLLTAAGPSGYEQAPAAVFREAAGAFAEVSFDSVGSTVAKVRIDTPKEREYYKHGGILQFVLRQLMAGD